MKLSPSLLSADFSRLYEEAHSVERFASRFHWDVMDGHFVPNLTFGPPVVNALRNRLNRPFDIHLMIDHPAEYAPQFRVLPSDSIIFHVESVDDSEETIRVIRAAGARVGVSLRPSTPLHALDPLLDSVSCVLIMSVEPGFGGQAFLDGCLDRIRDLSDRIGRRDIEIAVDGGIGPANARSIVEAGADILVAGSAIFQSPDREATMRQMLEAAG